MVVKMMKWSPWPPPTGLNQYEVKVKVERLEGIGGAEKGKVVAAEMRWKGPKAGLVSLRRRDRRNVTKEVTVGDLTCVQFGDEFVHTCEFPVSTKVNSFSTRDASFSILYGEGQEKGSKLSVIGAVSVNLAEIASQMQKDEKEMKIERDLPIPLQIGGVASDALLLISVSFINIQMSAELSDSVQETNVQDKDESFLRRVTSFVSPSGRIKKKNSLDQMEELSDSRLSSRFSGDNDDLSGYNTEDSPDDELAPTGPEQLGYSPITSSANLVSVAIEDDSAVCYSRSGRYEETRSVSRSESSPCLETLSGLPPKTGFLSWKKRRLSFRGRKRKEEPLLKKGNEEGGGDDIDFARRQLVSDSTMLTEKANCESTEKPALELEFGNDGFTVGSWEEKEFISRDGNTKLKANVFFASIDQRSESAGGESACTALVAVIADWIQSNQGAMLTRSEFDSLIQEGSSEWRKLCEDEAYRERFPDKHFDLDTVLEAGIRPISVFPEKSFVGFFHPENYEFLQGAMSFDSIWDEISSSAVNDWPRVYILSWNDHFFILKVDADAFYIIDTLGERLFEGCNQAYILKFDNGSSMCRVQDKETGVGVANPVRKGNQVKEMEELKGGDGTDRDASNILCSGRECCREFVKRFVAAIPLGQLEEEMKKGLDCSSALQRLQIEFHFTLGELSSSSSSSSLSSSTFSSPSRTTLR